MTDTESQALFAIAAMGCHTAGFIEVPRTAGDDYQGCHVSLHDFIKSRGVNGVEEITAV
jgi:hypothetical protein